MRNLLTDPVWREEDLGLPLPVDPHAVSVALPLWDHVVGYEENDPAVVSAMQCGYPRFFLHPLVRQLSEVAAHDLASAGESVWLFASKRAACRVAEFVGPPARRLAWKQGLEAVITPEPNLERAKLAWRFFGEGISSRRADSMLRGRPPCLEAAHEARQWIREDLAQRTGQHSEDVFLFPSGIAAMATAHRMVCRLRPNLPTSQIDFPYVDVLKVQESTAAGVELLDASRTSNGHLDVTGLDLDRTAGVFTEIASNPQLRTPDLQSLAKHLGPRRIPLAADDTIATFANVDVYPYADLVTTSLTKFYSGVGDVLAGSLILKRSSPLYEELRSAIEPEEETDLFDEDAIVLARNARDFDRRMERINTTAETVFEFLRSESLVETIWYPQTQTRGFYEAIRKPGGGYGGLLTFHLRNPSRNAPRFYDRLPISKGPSLGANFSLICPYMLLAHYPELDWTDRLGLDRHLLRLSVGLEPADELIRRFQEAFQVCSG